MLESGNVLKTWRINVPPELIGKEPTHAERIFDHNVKFLTYQGAVNREQGTVAIVDRGTAETLEEKQETIRLRLHGKILAGEFALEHIEHDHWRLFKV